MASNLNRMRKFILLGCMVASLCSPLLGQRARDPLSDEETDQVREVADRPVDRIKLYMKFIDQRVASMKQLNANPKAHGRIVAFRNTLDEFTRLVDELAENLDTYDDRHSDVRKALKDLVPDTQKWLDALNEPPQDAANDFARKTALDAAQSLADQSKKLQADQEKYFAEHKNERGKNGTGPS
jgi:gas vesicle protein